MSLVKSYGITCLRPISGIIGIVGQIFIHAVIIINIIIMNISVDVC